MTQQVIGRGAHRPGDFPPENITRQNGFHGMRQREILKFVKPFVESGAIEPISEQTPITSLLPMVLLLQEQGRFGDDPFNLVSGDNKALAEVAKVNARMDSIEENLGKMMGMLERSLGDKSAPPQDGPIERGNDGVEPPQPEHGEPNLAALARPSPVELSTLDWDELKRLARLGGIVLRRKSREDIEAELAPIMERARLEA